MITTTKYIERNCFSRISFVDRIVASGSRQLMAKYFANQGFYGA